MKPILLGLAGLGIILVVALFFVVQDNKIHLDEKYVVGQELCEKNICVIPITVSEDRLNASLFVYNVETNQTCVQHIEDGFMVPLNYFDCQPGHGWTGDINAQGGFNLE